MDDDEIPPPLESLATQVAAVGCQQLQRPADGTAAGTDPLADVTFSSVHRHGGRSMRPAMVRGFFDVDKKKLCAQKPPAERSDDAMPFLKATNGISASGVTIPDCLKVKPDAEAVQYDALKKDLLDKLKPDEDTIKTVMKSEELLEGFGDPEVMAAVGEVAADPKAFAKYKDNKKVQMFYARMANVLGAKLQHKA